MIPQHYDPTPYLDALEHGRKYLEARLVAVEAMLKTLQEETEQPTRVVILKDFYGRKEWKVVAIRKGNTIWESPISNVD